VGVRQTRSSAARRETVRSGWVSFTDPHHPMDTARALVRSIRARGRVASVRRSSDEFEGTPPWSTSHVGGLRGRELEWRIRRCHADARRSRA